MSDQTTDCVVLGCLRRGRAPDGRCVRHQVPIAMPRIPKARRVDGGRFVPGPSVIQPMMRLRSDGRWAVTLMCPDGTVRRFWSRKTVESDLRPAPVTRSRAPIPPRLRYEVLARDGHRCVYCGRSAPEVKLHVDHRVSVVDGGSTDAANLVASCSDCNLGKGRTSVA